jgi:hypothetical protein
MVAHLTYITNILRRDEDDASALPPGHQSDERTLFFEKIEKNLLGDTETSHVHDLYSQLMNREQAVLDTLNTVSNMYAAEKSSDVTFASLKVANIWQGMAETFMHVLQLASEVDLKTLLGMLYSDTNFRIYVGIWCAALAAVALVVWW